MNDDTTWDTVNVEALATEAAEISPVLVSVALSRATGMLGAVLALDVARRSILRIATERLGEKFTVEHEKMLAMLDKASELAAATTLGAMPGRGGDA